MYSSLIKKKISLKDISTCFFVFKKVAKSSANLLAYFLRFSCKGIGLLETRVQFFFPAQILSQGCNILFKNAIPMQLQLKL